MVGMQAKAIELNGLWAGKGRLPAICAPLVGRSREALLAEVKAVAAKGPDMLEWRVDFFDDIADTAEVVALARDIKKAAQGIALLFTRRSSREGGEKIALSEDQVFSLYRAVCADRQVDLVDYEMSNDAQQVQQLCELARRNAVKIILSFHDFQATPPLEVLCRRFGQAHQLGADVGKVAVMPQTMHDVLTLLSATLQSSRQLPIPLVGISMGALGSVSRLCGWTFGSAIAFAVGESPSAPGQMPIEDIRQGLAVLRRAWDQPTL